MHTLTTGGNFLGKPLICGGLWGSSDYNYNTGCYMFDGSSWTWFANMNHPRKHAAGIQLNQDQFWISGGLNNDEIGIYHIARF